MYALGNYLQTMFPFIKRKTQKEWQTIYIYYTDRDGETSCFMAWISATHVLIVVLLHIDKTFVKVHKTAVY